MISNLSEVPRLIQFESIRVNLGIKGPTSQALEALCLHIRADAGQRLILVCSPPMDLPSEAWMTRSL
jgi:hypothetical protein